VVVVGLKVGHTATDGIDGGIEGSGYMGQSKVRCTLCGAKNDESSVDRCRICGGLLPDAELRRKQVDTAGDTFKAIVEGEVENWRGYESGELDSTKRSRRPAELPPVVAHTAVPGQDMSGAPTSMVPGAAATVEAVPAETADDSASNGGGRLRRFFGG
jgi:hypothetical protein